MEQDQKPENHVAMPNEADLKVQKAKSKRDLRTKGRLLLGLGLFFIVMAISAAAISKPASAPARDEVKNTEKVSTFTGIATVLTFAGLILLKNSKED